MLIDRSIRSFEVLERKLSEIEKVEIFNIFYQVELRMGLTGLPENYTAWVLMRQQHLQQNMENSNFTIHLYEQYHKHLGNIRYFLLRQAQVLVAPKRVDELLELGNIKWLSPLITAYKSAKIF